LNYSPTIYSKTLGVELQNGKPGNPNKIIFYDEDEDTGYHPATQLSLAQKWKLILKPYIKS
jgi:hypothetical protein